MNTNTFLKTLDDTDVPASLSDEMKVLWYDAKDDWDTAHEIAQDMGNSNGDWLHAYLHRKEGDLGNASYWYRKAGKPVAKGSLKSEWEQLVEHFASR